MPCTRPIDLTLGAIDRELDPGTYSYRTMAFNGDDKALAASPVRTVNVKPVKALGALEAVVEGGTLTAGWTAFAGPEACFSTYKLVASTTDETPSYLDGAEALWAGESQGASGAVIEGLAPGTYHLRLEALRTTEAGKLLVAQTDTATIVVP